MHRTFTVGIALGIVFAAGASRADDLSLTCHEPPADAKIEVMFKPGVSVVELGVWVSGFTCKNVVFSPEVAKRATKVVIVPAKDVTPKQGLQLFLDAMDAVGLVATVKSDSIVVKQGPKLPLRCPDIAEVKPPPEPTDAERQKALSDLLDKGIKKIDATHLKVKRDVVDQLLLNPMAFVKGVRVVPAMKDGAPIGFKLYAIVPSSMFARLGFLNGDTITSVNGFALTSADKALELYTKLREATELKIAYDRAGSSITLTISIAD